MQHVGVAETCFVVQIFRSLLSSPAYTSTATSASPPNGPESLKPSPRTMVSDSLHVACTVHGTAAASRTANATALSTVHRAMICASARRVHVVSHTNRSGERRRAPGAVAGSRCGGRAAGSTPVMLSSNVAQAA